MQLAQVFTVFDVLRAQVSVDGLAGHPQLQAQQIALRVQTGFELAQPDGAEVVLRHVFFTGPHHLDGNALHLPAQQSGLANKVLRASAPAETAAQGVVVDFAFIQRQTAGGRQGGHGSLGILAGHPDLGTVVGDERRAVHGLHAGVGDKGGAVNRLDTFGCAGNHLGRVADVDVGKHVVGCGQAFFETGVDGGAAFLAVGAFVPDDGQVLQRHLGAPPVVGHHGHCVVVHFVDALNAFAALEFGGVKADQLAAKDRAGLNGRIDHAGQADVDGIVLFAHHLERGVHTLEGLAGNLPLARVTQNQGLWVWRCELGCGRGHLAVGELAACAGVGDHAFAHSHFAHRNAPLVGRRLQQHGAGCSAALAHVILRAANAAAAAGGHVTPDALACQVLAGRDHLYFDARPIAVEFFGHQLG